MVSEPAVVIGQGVQMIVDNYEHFATVTSPRKRNNAGQKNTDERMVFLWC